MNKEYFNRVITDAIEDNEYVGTILEETLSFINDKSVYVIYKSKGNSCCVYRDYDKAMGAFEEVLYHLTQEERDKFRRNTLTDDPDINSEFIDGGIVLESAVIPGDPEEYIILVSTIIE